LRSVFQVLFLLAGTTVEVLPIWYYHHSTGIVLEKEEKLADTQGLKCGRWPEVDWKFWLAGTTALLPGWYRAPMKSLQYTQDLKSESWPEVGRKFRLAGTTALVPAGWYY
jgi:hypothetical protein